jgi:hypothetical protein
MAYKIVYGDGAASKNFDNLAWRVLNLPHDWGNSRLFKIF